MAGYIDFHIIVDEFSNSFVVHLGTKKNSKTPKSLVSQNTEMNMK